MKDKVFYQLQGENLEKQSGERITSALIMRANECIEKSKNEELLKDSFEDMERLISFNILHKYQTEGHTEEFLWNYNQHSKRLNYKNIFVLDKVGKRAKLIEALDLNGYGGPQDLVLYTFICAYKSGHLDVLKRCSNEKCTKFFLGRSNKLSCSKRCSDLVRSRRKRKRDKDKKYNLNQY
ncbi:hypothetical protein ABMA75_03875 [Halobacteriovorax sp. ZH4_bin.1]|uniref:hypothetical protein n=1 Tax=unclassified Halobacteriovorax TaxID=2639665 RepID=UPI003712AB1F